MLVLPFIVGLAVGSAGGAGHPATVSEVISGQAELDGKVIYVQGFVLRCEQLGCALRDNSDKSVHAKSLSFGASEDFDTEIQEFLGKRVIVRAKLNATCLRKRMICLDRANELENPVLVNASR